MSASPWIEAAVALETEARKLRDVERVRPPMPGVMVSGFAADAIEQWLLGFVHRPEETRVLTVDAAPWILWRLEDAADFCRHCGGQPDGYKFSDVHWTLVYALLMRGRDLQRDQHESSNFAA